METNNLGKPIPEEEQAIWFIKIKSICGVYTEICGSLTGSEGVVCGMTKEEAEDSFKFIERMMLGKPRRNIVEIIKL